MFNILLTKLNSKQSFQFVEVYFTSDDLYILKIVKEFKQGVNIKYESYTFNSVESLINVISINTPIILLFNGKGIVYKKTPSNIKVESLKDVLPGISPNDYYFEQLESNNGQLFSVARKEKLDRIINLLGDNNLNIISVFIGYLFLNNLSMFDILEEKILIDANVELSFEDGYLNNVGSKSSHDNEYIKELLIDDQTISIDFLCYWIISRLKPNEYVKKSFINPIVNKNCNIYFEKITLNKITMYFIAFIVLVLLGIFYLKSYHIDSLRISGSVSNSNYTVKQEKFIDQKKIIKNLNWNDEVRYSLYLDIIGSTVPNDIYLTELEINSMVVNDDNSGNKKSVKPGFIDIKGITKKSYDLNIWINVLKNKKWIKGIVLKDFRKLDQQKSEFNLLIEIN